MRGAIPLRDRWREGSRSVHTLRDLSGQARLQKVSHTALGAYGLAHIPRAHLAARRSVTGLEVGSRIGVCSLFNADGLRIVARAIPHPEGTLPSADETWGHAEPTVALRFPCCSRWSVLGHGCEHLGMFVNDTLIGLMAPLWKGLSDPKAQRIEVQRRGNFIRKEVFPSDSRGLIDTTFAELTAPIAQMHAQPFSSASKRMVSEAACGLDVRRRRALRHFVCRRQGGGGFGRPLTMYHQVTCLEWHRYQHMTCPTRRYAIGGPWRPAQPDQDRPGGHGVCRGQCSRDRFRAAEIDSVRASW